MVDAITSQVSEQVRRVMEAVSSARPSPPFDYLLVHEGEPSHRPEGIPSPRHTERGRHKQKGWERRKDKKKGRGSHVGLYTILMLLLLKSPGLGFQGVSGLILGNLALGRRRDKLHPLRVTTLHGSPLAIIHVVEVGLKWLNQHNLTEVPEGVGAVLLVALLLSWGRVCPGLFQLMLQPFLLGLTSIRLQSFAAPLIPRDEPFQPPALRNSPHPRAKTSTMAISCSVTLWGSEAPGVIRSQDLTMSWTRETLAARSALMKLAEGRGASGEGPPVVWVVAPTALEGVRCSCLAGAYGRLLPTGHEGGYLQGKDLVCNPRDTRRGNKLGHIPYLLGLLSNKALPLLLPPVLGVGHHLFGSGVPGLEDCQPCPRLICIKQKRSQVSTKHKTRRLSTLGVILEDHKAGRSKEEVIGENFNLGSQFQASRSLDLLLLFSGPFTDSIA
ncbi:LOW QUALITY PROTEIN: hypothetical protein Cgig2_021338 [Carnegiea gigantea]|uniref:Uncharacterized protein n=1 Tax=Carnegiea gigantea TaxID=171969 RepID=A0A9Q1GSW9_9CARY|nr:LOW QUALITY PROTEIN: hypothetical protein Cgig2_021338 [Carnegiea gigantea]